MLLVLRNRQRPRLAPEWWYCSSTGAVGDATHGCDTDDARGDEAVASKRDYAAEDGAKQFFSFISCCLALSTPQSPTPLLIPQVQLDRRLPTFPDLLISDNT